MMTLSHSNEKLRRTFVREEAYIILRDWIIQGKLEPGQQLRDKELAEQLGVSRTPIREALLRLEDEGFVQTKPNRSTTVSPIDFHDTFHLYSIAWSLERLALEQAFEQINSQHLQMMVEINQKLKSALEEGDKLKALEADNEFHSMYIELSGNKELKRILLGVKQKLRRLELYYFDKATDVHLSCDEHTQMIEALEQKNLPLALNAVELNWKHGFSRIQGYTAQVKQDK
ncbi:GntR family transcriptional regulator [Aneurinibacillus aneurinilyticus]|nr:GntR family transcriptional regulator [Aneurinibacillus aneurinilyticus]